MLYVWTFVDLLVDSLLCFLFVTSWDLGLIPVWFLLAFLGVVSCLQHVE